jgi:pimeloyl-ACP methyl ester carboxylesterase
MHVKQTVALVAVVIAAGPLTAQQADPRGEGEPRVVTRMVEVDGHTVRVQTAGWHHRLPGRPVVVLENGAGAPLEAWQPILAAIAEFAPVVAYDRAGIGQSPWDEQTPTPEHVNGKLRALLAELEAQPPYVLVGFSWGGALIQYFAGQWPGEVAGLVFIDAPDPRWRREAELAAVAELGGGEAERLAFYRALAPLIAQLPPSHQAELRVIEELVTTAGGALAALAQPAVPTARLVAGRHDPMPPGLEMPFDERAFWHGVLRHSIGRFAASLLEGPHASLIVAAHARHYIMGDDPQLVIEAIRRVSAAASATRQQRTSVIDVAPPTGAVETDRASIVAAVERARPGEGWDRELDHAFLLGSLGAGEDSPAAVNGELEPGPITLRAGATHRLRFMHMSPDDDKRVFLLADGKPVEWQQVAKDGADLPATQVRTLPADLAIHVGETYDFLWTPQTPGGYTLRIVTTFDRGAPLFPRAAPAPHTQDITVRVR